MARAKIVVDGDGRFYGVRFNCPGCAADKGQSWAGTVLSVDWTPPGYERSPLVKNREVWEFNGDLDRPTFAPSILSHTTWGPERRPICCHSYVRDGRIQFLHDCTHPLAGQTLDLPEIQEAE